MSPSRPTPRLPPGATRLSRSVRRALRRVPDPAPGSVRPAPWDRFEVPPRLSNRARLGQNSGGIADSLARQRRDDDIAGFERQTLAAAAKIVGQEQSAAEEHQLARAPAASLNHESKFYRKSLAFTHGGKEGFKSVAERHLLKCPAGVTKWLKAAGTRSGASRKSSRDERNSSMTCSFSSGSLEQVAYTSRPPGTATSAARLSISSCAAASCDSSIHSRSHAMHHRAVRRICSPHMLAEQRTEEQQ